MKSKSGEISERLLCSHLNSQRATKQSEEKRQKGMGEEEEKNLNKTLNFVFNNKTHFKKLLSRAKENSLVVPVRN